MNNIRHNKYMHDYYLVDKTLLQTIAYGGDKLPRYFPEENEQNIPRV